METSSIRRAPENARFRLVNREDLVTGIEITMVDYDANPYQLAHPYQTIALDDEPVRDTVRGLYVYYHCIRPIWAGQCFVPLANFIGEVKDFYDTRYWLPISQ